MFVCGVNNPNVILEDNEDIPEEYSNKLEANWKISHMNIRKMIQTF